MKKITKREVLTAILDGTVGAGNVTEADVKAYATKEIELLDKRAASAKARAEKAKAEGDELIEVVANALGEDFEPISVILERITVPEFSAAKASSRLKKLVEAGRAEKGEIKIKPTEGGRARTLVAYRAI